MNEDSNIKSVPPELARTVRDALVAVGGAKHPPAPYTRATITRLRELAKTRTALEIAADLGWSLQRLKEVGRTHLIEIVSSTTTETPSPSSAQSDSPTIGGPDAQGGSARNPRNSQDGTAS